MAADLHARYLALDVRDFDAAWAAVRRLGVRGGNVTVPWKEAAARALDVACERVQRTRSANTFWRDADGRLAGTQTDGPGFIAALREALGLEPEGLRAAVLGAGGGARAVLHALGEAGASELYLWNRTRGRAEELAAELGAAGYAARPRLLEEAGGRPRLSAGLEVDLVVNGTSAGLQPGEPAPAVPRDFPGAMFAMDMVYDAQPTPFVHVWARAGAHVADGREMLLQQAALAFERWFQLPAPVVAMRSALERELGVLRLP